MDGPAASRASRWAIACLLFVAGIALYGTSLLEEPLSGDEGSWMLQGTTSWRLLRTGRFDDPFWSWYHMLWGYPSPPVSKYLIGIGMAAAGWGDPESVGAPVPPESRARWGFTPPVLRAGRLSSVVLGSLAIAALLLILGRDLPRRVALTGAVLLATSPVWFSASRRALTDIHGVAASLFVLPAFLGARAATRAGRPRAVRVSWWVGVGVIVGLSVGCKFSAAASATGLAALLLLEGLLRSGPPSRAREVGFALTATAVCVAAATFVFVLGYPYLWPDPIRRFLGILAAWRVVREQAAAAYNLSIDPGVEYLRVAMENLVLPGGAVSWALLPPLLGAAWLRGKGASADFARVGAWGLTIPAFLGGAFLPNGILHAWIGWAGLLGATAAAIAVRGSVRRVLATDSLLVLAAGALGSLVFLVLTNYIAWPRYFLPILPACAAFAAVGFDDLRRSVAAIAGRGPARLVDAAFVFGVLSVLSIYPRVTAAKMRMVSAREVGALPAGLQGIAAACLAAAIGVACWRALRHGRAPQETGAAPR